MCLTESSAQFGGEFDGSSKPYKRTKRTNQRNAGTKTELDYKKGGGSIKPYFLSLPIPT